MVAMWSSTENTVIHRVSKEQARFLSNKFNCLQKHKLSVLRHPVIGLGIFVEFSQNFSLHFVRRAIKMHG